MGKKVEALKAIQVTNAKPREKDYKLQDGEGLYLLVRTNGKKVWMIRYWLTPEKDGLYTIGEHSSKLGLAEARVELARVKELVKKGINPTLQRKSEKMLQLDANENSFQAVAEEWMEVEGAEWKPKTVERQTQMLRDYVFPRIGVLPIKDIESPHILAVLSEIQRQGKPVVAVKVKTQCRRIFNFAIARLKADRNPVLVLESAVRLPPTKHAKSLNRPELVDLMKQVLAYNGRPETLIAIRLMMLTFVRTNELVNAAWSEFDFLGEFSEWYIPGKRMKMKQPHIVPLSRQAVALLQELKVLNAETEFILPNMVDMQRPMNKDTINNALVRMGYRKEFSGHGFRSTASTILNEMDWPADAIERQLAHAPHNKVRASYNHAQYMETRREMMQAWADWLDSIAPPGWTDPILPANVTPLDVARLPAKRPTRIHQIRSSLKQNQA